MKISDTNSTWVKVLQIKIKLYLSIKKFFLWQQVIKRTSKNDTYVHMYVYIWHCVSTSYLPGCFSYVQGAAVTYVYNKREQSYEKWSLMKSFCIQEILKTSLIYEVLFIKLKT